MKQVYETYEFDYATGGYEPTGRRFTAVTERDAFMMANTDVPAGERLRAWNERLYDKPNGEPYAEVRNVYPYTC